VFSLAAEPLPSDVRNLSANGEASGGCAPILLELDVILDDHHQLVDVVHVVGPDLAGPIDPEAT
jgi:hypothetical protein